jgi:ADP-heptose:LPS heptosyltransferase
MNPLYTVCILCHNQLELTKKCIESVLRSKDVDRTQIVVVNNGSTDDTRTYLGELSRSVPNFGVHNLPRNEWVGRAYNEGLAFAHAPYFVTLNNDIEILDPDWLAKMREPFLSDPLLALVGIVDTCCSLTETGMGHQGETLDYVECSCAMSRTVLMRQHTLFDPAYRFGYCEDSDLSLRLRKKGFHIGRVDIQLNHVRAVTTRAVFEEGLDLPGYQAINFVTFHRRWSQYLKTRNFTERIAIRRTGAIGDVILLTPLLRAIKKENAHAEVSVFTDCDFVLRDNPDVHTVASAADFVHVYKMFDKSVNLDLAYEFRQNMHILQAYAECADQKVTDWSLRVYPNAEERFWAKEALPEENWLVMHPHSGQHWPGKNWDKFNELAWALRKDGWKICLVGNDPNPIACDLDLRGLTSFHQLAALMERAQLFVGVDSAPMHLAQAALIPTVAIFGATNPRNIFLPLSFIRPASVSMDECGCLGCHTMYAPPRLTPLCVRERDVCMERLDVGTVLETIRQALRLGGRNARYSSGVPGVEALRRAAGSEIS